MTQGRLFPDGPAIPDPVPVSVPDSSAAPEDVWRPPPQPPVGFSDRLGLPALHALLLYNRGIRLAGEVAPFLAADERLLHDPHLIPGMDEAVELFERVIGAGGKVAVYGDFDVDGISGTALLCRTVTELGGRPLPFLPNRMSDGHGLNPDAIKKLAADGARLLITVDTGTTAAPEVALARSLGMEVIVTDHHVATDGVPEGVPVLNPGLTGAYPYTGLTGAGVAFKLAQAVYASAGLPFPEPLLELAALGTVADVAPLTGENRFIVSRGLSGIRRTTNVGINALAKRGDIDLAGLSARDLSFGIIPRLNSAGRMDDPGISLRLLTTDEPTEAAKLADRLEALNAERRRVTDRGVREAEEMVSSADLVKNPALVVHSADWHIGIVGLIAARLSERYGRPAVAGTLADGKMRASARGPAGVSVVNAIGATGLPFLRMGGHAQAAGFTLDESHIGEFETLFPLRVAGLRDGPIETDAVEYDCELELSAVNQTNHAFIESLAPFGEGNPAPTFMTRGVKVSEARTVGRDDAHLKLRLFASGTTLEAIAFGHGPRFAELGRSIDVVYSIQVNDWGGRRRLELKVVDFRAPG